MPTTSSDITKAITRPLRNFPSNAAKALKKVSDLPRAGIDSVTGNISKLRNLDQQSKVIQQMGKTWEGALRTPKSPKKPKTYKPRQSHSSVLVTGKPMGKMKSPQGNSVQLYEANVYKNGHHVGDLGVSRAPYDQPSGQKANSRYGTYGEIPPGSYDLSPGPEKHRMNISDDRKDPDVTIKGTGANKDRTVIQFHPGVNSVGCMTTKNTASPWSKEKKSDDFWKLKNTINNDLQNGNARVFVVGRHKDEGLAGKVRDGIIKVGAYTSPGVTGGEQGPYHGPQYSELNFRKR